VCILYMSEFSRLDLHLHLWRRFDLRYEGVHLDAVHVEEAVATSSEEFAYPQPIHPAVV
jgi:hypothetical protein